MSADVRRFVAFDAAGFPFGLGYFDNILQAAREFKTASDIREVDQAEYKRLLDIHRGVTT